MILHSTRRLDIDCAIELINIFSKALFMMQGTYAVSSVSNTIDLVLEKGAHKLYDRYLDQKLP